MQIEPKGRNKGRSMTSKNSTLNAGIVWGANALWGNSLTPGFNVVRGRNVVWGTADPSCQGHQSQTITETERCYGEKS